MKNIFLAIKKIVQNGWFLGIGVVIILTFFIILIMVPVLSIPGNDFAFQISLFGIQDFSIMFLLSLLSGLVITMQMYIWNTNRTMKKKQSTTVAVVKTGGTSIAAIIAAISSTAACSACLTFVLGLMGLGFGTSLFILENQIYFLIGSLLLMLVSLYFTAKRMMGICEACEVKKYN